MLFSVPPLKQSNHDNKIIKMEDHEKRTLSLNKMTTSMHKLFCFSGSSSACMLLFKNIFQLYFLLFLFSSQQPPAPPTTSPSSVRRASTSLLRAQLLFGQVLSSFFLSFLASVVVVQLITCGFIIQSILLTSLLLLCGALFIIKNIFVLPGMTLPH